MLVLDLLVFCFLFSPCKDLFCEAHFFASFSLVLFRFCGAISFLFGVIEMIILVIVL